MKKMIPYLLCLAFAFYILPECLSLTLVSWTTGGLILFALPLIVFMIAVIYGFLHAFKFIFCILTGLLFVPAAMIFFTSSVIVYALVYSIVALMGLWIGTLLGNRWDTLDRD